MPLGVVMPYVPVAQRMEGLARHIAAQHRGEKVLLLATGDNPQHSSGSGFQRGMGRGIRKRQPAHAE